MTPLHFRLLSYSVYADDTQFIHTGTIDDVQHLVKKIERSITKVKKYFHLNGLMLNANKTQCLYVGSRGLLSQIPSDTAALS